MTETILVSYNQICVFDATLDEPFNDWADDHVHQGFAWRAGSVSFGAVENEETVFVIEVDNPVELDPVAFRVITVPFTVPEHQGVIVGSIGDEREIKIDPGTYQLTFELGRKNEKPWCRISFVKNANPQPRVIKADSEITKLDSFLMSASPAA
ncbi:competence protein ComJ [Paraburkholderia sp.]|uniref:competence protein ComJ n=1 Tax=Paraburkholderia sp. TaxID=1926495 RepID=UPI003D6F58CB